MTVTDIMSKFGGLSAFAAAVNVPVSTASSWKANNYIPSWRQRDVLEIAFELKLDISAADFPLKKAVAA